MGRNQRFLDALVIFCGTPGWKLVKHSLVTKINKAWSIKPPNPRHAADTAPIATYNGRT